MEKKYVLAIDQSTSSTKAILFNKKGQLVHRCSVDHRQYYPKPGWVEHDVEEIFENTLKAISMVLEETEVPPQKIAVLGITNQRETVVVWDKITGKPVYNAVVWQCQRGSEICKDLEEQGHARMVQKKTGLVISPYFCAAKIKWILDNISGARQKAKRGELIFGTMDSWLLWKLTQGKIHATDYSNASRTQLFNIHDLKWDADLFKLFTIPESMAPIVKCSNDVFGYTLPDQVFKTEIPIAGLMGDSHAALFGQNCFEKGMAKATYGTGSSIMMNIGKKPLESLNGLVTSIAWGFEGEIEYVFEGNINCTGATIKWLVDDLQLIPDSKISGQIAKSVDSNAGVYIVPAFVGLSAPYWDSDAKASITGITRGTGKAHIVRAAEESIAYQVKDVLDLMIKESNIELKELRVDGGPTRDGFLMQFQADILDISIARNKIEELSAIGAAFMAGLAVGFWADKMEIMTMWTVETVFKSKMDEAQRRELYKGWKEAIRRTLSTF